MTDYASLSAVKAALGSNETTDDALLATLITQASRAIDRYCAGFTNSDDYFIREAIANEQLLGNVAWDGSLYCWPCKPRVENVTAISYRFYPDGQWIAINTERVAVDGYTVIAWRVAPLGYGKVQVRISYVGGFDPLPADLENATVLLSVRFYKEIKSGLTDSIGVAELGMLQYTKAFPARVIEMLRPYKRIVAL